MASAAPPPGAPRASGPGRWMSGHFSVCLAAYDTRRGQAEGREAEKLLAFFPPNAPPAMQSAVVGLAQAVTMFAGTFNKVPRGPGFRRPGDQRPPARVGPRAPGFGGGGGAAAVARRQRRRRGHGSASRATQASRLHLSPPGPHPDCCSAWPLSPAAPVPARTAPLTQWRPTTTSGLCSTANPACGC
jgi:hypothetical protein